MTTIKNTPELKAAVEASKQIDWSKVHKGTTIEVSNDGIKWFEREFSEHRPHLTFAYAASNRVWLCARQLNG